MKWSEMSARERDVLVARCIFHYVAKPEQNFCLDETGAPIPFNHYTTDISAAWEVVEKMAQKMRDDHRFKWDGPFFKSKHQYMTNEGYPLGTECWFVRVETYEGIECVCCETPTEAICKAALKAVGVEIE